MIYKQYRLAKRNGEIVQQVRMAIVTAKPTHPIWKIWKLHQCTYNYEYTEWTDIPIVELKDE